MKQLFIVAMILVVGFTFDSVAEPQNGQHNNETTNGRNEQTQHQSKLFNYVSACLAGRAIPTPVGNLDFQPSNTTTPPLQTGNGGNGRSVFEASCLKCHNGSKPGASNFTVINANMAANAITKVQSGEMPKGGSLSGPDKEALIAYLKSVK